MRRLVKVVCLAVCVLTSVGVSAQTSLHLKGGISTAFKVDFKNVNPSAGVNISPEVGGGLSHELENGLRFGANYEFTKMTREQRLSSFDPTEPRLNLPGATYSGGTAFREMWSYFNSAALTFEYNFANAIPEVKLAGVGIYLGTGVGMLFAKGNRYELSMAHEEWQDPNNIQQGIKMGDHWIQKSWLSAENTPHKYNSFYLPLSFCVDLKVAPRLAIGLTCDYRFIFANAKTKPSAAATSSAAGLAPKGLLTAGAVIRVILF